MKALVKPQSRQYFKKFEQPIEDLQTTMNNIQFKKIAKFVGIDPNEVKNFTWFFQIVSKLKLPKHYSRYLSEKKDEVIYLNEITHQEAHQHPSIALLKSLFYQTLANNKALYTFVEKESKLLPFVEQKMLRQCIGISSKRRDAEKVNLQRDENGRMAMSKLERINPDFKSLLASRSYMLKMLVEKVFTRKEVLGKGKRANSYLTAITQYKQMMKQAQPQEDQQIESQQNFQLYQRIFQNSAYFYVNQYGNLENIPSRIINSKQYMQSTPQNVLKNIFLLNIDKQNIELYWLARIMDCLPCPPNWSKKKGSSFDSYLFQPEKILFDIHPSYVYILHQINRFKSVFNKLSPIRQSYYINMRQLNFFDFFERKYTVDMYGYIQKSQKNNNKLKKKDRTKMKQEQLSDWMILEGVNNCFMAERQYVLIQHIQKFWSSLDFNFEPWSPSISPYGEVVWSSNVNNKSLSINPYKPKLSNLIKAQIKKLPYITDQILKKEYKSNKDQHFQQEDEDAFIFNVEKSVKQRQDFLEYYLTHQDKAVPFPYEIKGQFSNMNQNNYFDQIFISPFDLDKDIVTEGEPLPFWLQKAKAKQHTTDNINLLIFNPQDYSQIKQKITKYALQMVGEHEPHLIEQTEKKLNRISNPDELIKFLNHINDLDLRQQRKKQYLQSLKFTEQDSDIFGSEISQMEIEDAVDDQQSVVQSVKSESRQVTEKSSVKQKSVQSQEQPQIIQMVEQIPVVLEKIIPKENEPYQFLKHFKKNYFRNIKISQMSHEQFLRRIQLAIKSKIKVSKYKRGLILKKVKKQLNIVRQMLPFLKQQNQKDFNQIRWNLIISHLRHANIPYQSKKSVKRVKEKINTRNSQINYSQITDYNQFLSEISQYDAEQMQKDLQELRKNKIAQRKLKTLTETSNNQHQITNDTIQLQPIYQIKPQIRADPVLRHIKSVSTQLKEFRSTFNPRKKLICSQKDQQESRNNNGIRKVISLKNLQQKLSNYNSTPASLSKNTSTKKIQKLDINTRLSLTKREGMGSVPHLEQQKLFYRVCLDHTASHFLGKEAFLRKGDIITMQARKTLLSKGRGLETYISKFY